MKAVAVSQRVDWIESRCEYRDALDQRLCDFLIDAGFLPYPVPNAFKFSKIDFIIKWLENFAPKAIVLSGGNNIGEFESRDTVEHNLIEYAVSKKIPLLGICRGMQFLGSFFGATLENILGHAGSRHELIQPKIGNYNFPKIVNSYHDFSLRNLPESLEIIATDSEGNCEAICHKSLPIEGWMWHPEREKPFSTIDIQNIRRVLNND